MSRNFRAERIALANALAQLEHVEYPPGNYSLFDEYLSRTRADRKSVAACMIGTAEVLEQSRLNRVKCPTLFVKGTRDNIVGELEGLSEMLKDGTAHYIDGKNHFSMIPTRAFKDRALAFLATN